jgi:predicted ATPase
MNDPVPKLRGKWEENNRYANFGAILRSLRVRGFRGIEDFTLELEFPVTAISGLNGSGKSTLGQLGACGYRKPTESVGYRRHYVKDFFPVSVADPSPFVAGASVEYTYESNQAATPQAVTVTRLAKEWSGYKRQPERYVYYVGFTLYLPKVERKDLSIYRGAVIELKEERALSDAARAEVGKILNQPYDGLHFQGYSHKHREAELGMAERWGEQYSENNMGFGEGRALYMVDTFETAPEQSLFVLEEPETSLHEDAQRKLAKYLLDVAERRRHQIILSTHSSVILDALPSESRKLLYRDADGIVCYSGLTSTRARAFLAGGAAPALTVCVEDDFAKLVLTEILRRFNAPLLQACEVYPVGDKNAVRSAVELLRRLNRAAIGVRDGDIGPAPDQHLWSLPGDTAPEREVMTNPDVTATLNAEFGLDVNGFFALHEDLDIHEVPTRLAAQARVPVDALNYRAIQCYCQHLTEQDCAPLVAAVADNA